MNSENKIFIGLIIPLIFSVILMIIDFLKFFPIALIILMILAVVAIIFKFGSEDEKDDYYGIEQIGF